MALTAWQFFCKVIRTVFYFTLLCMMTKEVFSLPYTDSYYNIAANFMENFIMMFTVLSALVCVFFLLVFELEEPPDMNVGRYTIYDRKILYGFIKNAGVQTDTDTLVTVFKSNQSSRHSSIRESDYDDVIDGLNNDGEIDDVGFDPETIETGKIVSRRSSRKIFATDSDDVQHEREPIALSYIDDSAVSFNKTEISCSCDAFLVNPESNAVTFTSLGGIEKFKQILEEFVIKPFVSGQITFNGPVNVPKAIMLVGGTGVGKTVIVEAMVNQLRSKLLGSQLKFYKVDGTNCFGSSIGCGAKLYNIFHDTLERSTCVVILFDNIDRLFDTSVLLLLSEMGSITPGRVLVIATARNREHIDERLLQIGGFDYIFQVPLPDVINRIEILQIHFKKRNCPIKDQQIADLASLTPSFNAGELERLVVMINQQAKARYLTLSQNNDSKFAFHEPRPESHNQFKMTPSNQRVAVAAKLTPKEISAYESFMNRIKVPAAASEENFANSEERIEPIITTSQSGVSVATMNSADCFNHADSGSECSVLSKLARLLTNTDSDKQ